MYAARKKIYQKALTKCERHCGDPAIKQEKIGDYDGKQIKLKNIRARQVHQLPLGEGEKKPQKP